MGRRRTNLVPKQEETLSKETPEVQEKLLEEIIETDNSQENEVEPVLTEEQKKDNLSNEETKIPGFKPGDHVKLHKDIKFDLLGRRIHEGLRNYQYRILSVRVDGMLIIECLTHCFTVQPKDVDLI